jgi:hypothetical protein
MGFAAALEETPISSFPRRRGRLNLRGQNKAANAIRATIMEPLGVYNVYDLNRLHLEVQAPSMFRCKKTITDFFQFGES